VAKKTRGATSSEPHTFSTPSYKILQQTVITRFAPSAGTCSL